MNAVSDGRLLLRQIDYQADSVTRTYIVPDCLVRETPFVPLDQAAAVITYEVEGARQVDIDVSFQPVLDLMGPASQGGQYTQWNEPAQSFEIAGSLHGLTAMVGSRESIAHDDTRNSTVRESRLSFSVRPHAGAQGKRTATVYVVLNEARAKDPAASMHTLHLALPQTKVEAEARTTAEHRLS